MKIEQQVCTWQQGGRLRDLGVKNPHIFSHVVTNNQKDGLTDHVFDTKAAEKKHAEWSKFTQFCNTADMFPAYTVAELGEMLPTLGIATLKSNNGNGGDIYTVCGSYHKIAGTNFNSPHEAQARAAMLIYLLENNLHTL